MVSSISSQQFQSTLPLRGATGSWTTPSIFIGYFNPHSPCGERRTLKRVNPKILSISIHTPLAGSDISTPVNSSRKYDFNPHSPCGERQFSRSYKLTYDKFQSTLPLRGATESDGNEQFYVLISIHTPLAGSDDGVRLAVPGDGISIHTPLAGSDEDCLESFAFAFISIHTPLAGSDRRNETFLTK